MRWRGAFAGRLDCFLLVWLSEICFENEIEID
jgi:hypothetical protein